MEQIEKQLNEQLNKAILLGNNAYNSIQNDSDRYGDTKSVLAFLTSARAVIIRISGKESTYTKNLEEIMSRNWGDSSKVEYILGVLQSLSEDFNSGYLVSYSELIHGELFGNFLEMADHLISEGYKDAAAVISGSTLEEHLRQLCLKNGIRIERTDSTRNIIPIKADKMNSDLSSSGVYKILDQKNVTAWLDLRNKAAHGKYSEYTKEQVLLMISGIRDFITRNSA
jgi:hypothetical protein